MPKLLDAVRIAADKETLQLADRLGDGGFAVFERGFANAVKAFVGEDLNEDPVGSIGVTDDWFEGGDFHERSL